MRYLVHKSPNSNQPLQLAVGHIVKCPDFCTGLRWKATPQGPITVAWRGHGFIDSHIRSNTADPADDPTRANAVFIVSTVALREAEGAEDVFPNSFRFSRLVTCIRLDDDYSFTSESERISFSLNEPMSVAEPKESSIEILGFSQLPIFWAGYTQDD